MDTFELKDVFIPFFHKLTTTSMKCFFGPFNEEKKIKTICFLFSNSI